MFSTFRIPRSNNTKLWKIRLNKILAGSKDTEVKPAQRAKCSMIWLAQQQYGRLALAGNSLTLKKNKINDMPAQLSHALP